LPGAAYRRLLDDQTRVLGADHPDTLIIRGNLTYLLVEAGQCPARISCPFHPRPAHLPICVLIVCAGNTPWM
jgi:hypothetical protein